MKHGPAVAAGLLSSTSHEMAGFILSVLHVLTYVPLALLPAMQDAHLQLAVVLNTSLCLCLTTGSALFHRLGIVKVFPKTLDTFLLVLYASMIPVVYLQYSWLADWINVYHSGAVAIFVWLSVLLPCWDSFATEPLKDRLPEAMWSLPAVKAAGLRVSITWGLVLTLCTIAAVPPAVLAARHQPAAMHIVCDYVLVLVLLSLGGAMQWRTTTQLLAAQLGHPSSDPAAAAGSAVHTHHQHHHQQQHQLDLEAGAGPGVEASAVRLEQQQRQQQ